MPQKKNQHKSKSTSGRRRSIVQHRRPNVFIRLLQHTPGWAWWIGGSLVVAAYVFFFYYIFVSPFGFRWRALQYTRKSIIVKRPILPYKMPIVIHLHDLFYPLATLCYTNDSRFKTVHIVFSYEIGQSQ